MTAGQLAPKQILLVEDEPDNRNLISQICDWLGYRLIEAVNGEEGIRIAMAVRPDLILMDLSLPVLDGWAATAALKSSPATIGIPIIAFTAHILPGERARALAAGCDEYISKPIELARFRDVLEFYLGKGGKL